tara:strand:- start:66 stop:623 length:558 start_codon:yes stop_codon:yes gene_type:complete
MPKRTSAEVEVVPEGFKTLPSGRIVSSKYHLVTVDKKPVLKAWFADMKDDSDEKKVKVYVATKDLASESLQFLLESDDALAEAAKLKNINHCSLFDDDRSQVKLSLYLKYPRRKKQNIIEGDFTVSGKFLLSSVYEYSPDNDKTYYGINLVVPRSQKKPSISSVVKPKAQSKKEEKEEEESDECP